MLADPPELVSLSFRPLPFLPFDFQFSKFGGQIRPGDYRSKSNPLMENPDLELLSGLIDVPVQCVCRAPLGGVLGPHLPWGLRVP